MEVDDIGILVGKTLSFVSGEVGGDKFRFHCNDGTVYQLCHHQDCCERVEIEDIVGNIYDLTGAPILIAREDSNVPTDTRNPEWPDDSYTWTFYNLATIKGHVTIRWYGHGNGYYSERVEFEQVL